MIEINLLPGKKKVSKGAGMKLSMPDFKGLIAQVKDPWLIGAIGAWVVVGGGGALLFITDRARLAAAETRLENVRTEKRRYDIVIAQKRQAEKVRDSLLYEINVIKGIDADRYIWPHVLDQATKALPPYTWITSIQSVSTLVAPAIRPPRLRAAGTGFTSQPATVRWVLACAVVAGQAAFLDRIPTRRPPWSSKAYICRSVSSPPFPESTSKYSSAGVSIGL